MPLNLLEASAAHMSRQSLTSRIYESLKISLAEGDLVPGQKLTPRLICEHLGVSQTPVREAMLQLVAERSLTLNPNRSITVPELTHEKFIELRDMRVALEGLAARQAALLAQKSTVAPLVKIHTDLMRAKSAKQFADTLRLNRLFHFAVYELSQRQELIGLIASLWSRTGPYLNFLYKHSQPTVIDPHPHEALLESLASNDAAGAERAIAQDIIEGGRNILDILKDRDL